MSTRVELKRRDFLKLGAGAALGGGLLIGFRGGAHASAGALAAGEFSPNGFIRIDLDGRITLIMPKVEMGQGTYTGHAMLLAEELDVGLDQVHLDHP